MRIHFGGNRKSFDWETGNKEEAAAKARVCAWLAATAPPLKSGTLTGPCPPRIGVASA